VYTVLTRGAVVKNSSLLPPPFRFGLFELNPQSGELHKNGMKIRIQGQPVEILIMLLQRPGEVVTREELQKKLWPADTFVDFEQGLNNAIKRLRAAIDDDSENPRFIETLPRRGYRFIGPVTQLQPIQATVRVAEDEDKVAEKEEQKASPERSKRRLWPTLLGLAAACLFTALGVHWISYLTRPPRVLGYKQLTNDHHIKSQICGLDLTWVGSDGPRVFFSEPGASVVQVSSSGGDVIKLPHPSKCFIVSDISPDKTELLGGTREKSSDLDLPLWTLSLATGEAHRLGNLIGHAAAWLPDNQRITYAVGDDISGEHGNDIYIASRDGSDARKLSRIKAGFVWRMRWSPDGRVLRVGVSHQKGSFCPVLDISADGTNLQAVNLRPRGKPWGCWFDWSLDARYSLLVVGREPWVGADIWVFPEKRSLFPWRPAEPTQLTTGPMSFWAPAPSPDGKRIYAVGGQSRGELLRYDLKSQRLEPYLSGISADEPNFSRDGKWIAYSLFPEGSLWRSRVDGSERMQLTSPPLIGTLPSWSPDGRRIAFSGGIPAGGHWQTYIVPAEGGKSELVPQSQEHELNPTWTPDGNSLIIGGYAHMAQTRITSIDLRTNRVTIIPGSEGMRSPRISPDGRYIVALESQTDSKFFLFDQQTQKWSLLVESSTIGIGWQVWSSDSKYVYFCNWAESPVHFLYRVRIADRKVERVAGINVPEGLTGYFGAWITPAPDGSPILLRDMGSQEIYALDVDLP